MVERRFFCESLQPGRVCLSDDEAHHARNVVRVRVGDGVRLFDGRGMEATARIEAVRREAVELFVERVEPADERTRPIPVTLAVAMPKGARQDVLIEKCTELGTQAIWPILTRRSVVRPGPGRPHHWRHVSIAAAKQSRRAYLPQIIEPIPFNDLLHRIGDFNLTGYGSTDPQAPSLPGLLSRWSWAFGPPVEDENGAPARSTAILAVELGSMGILPMNHHGRDARATAHFRGSPRLPEHLLLVIGPEGGLEPDEQALLDARGARAFSLGAPVLRVETAAIAALAILGACWSNAGGPHPPGCPQGKPTG